MTSDDLINQAQGFGGSRFELARGQHQFHSLQATHDFNRAGRAPKARENAQLNFRETQACFRDILGNAVIACQRHLKSATQAIALNRRHGDAVKFFKTIEHFMNAVDFCGNRFRGGETIKFADIGAEDKTRALA